MGDFTRIGDIDNDTLAPQVGDVYRDRDMLKRPAGGTVHVTDTLPVNAEKPTHVVIEDERGQRERVTVEDLRRRFVFRRRSR
jgi:hypothetical protein